MAGPDRGSAHPSLSALLALATAAVTLLAACSGAPEPEIGSRKTEAMEQIERTKQAAGGSESSELLPATGDADVGEPEPTVPPPADPSRTVRFETVDPREGEEDEPTLFEAAQAERLRRQASPRTSKLVITDENLQEYAKGGRLTELVTEGVDDGSDEDSAIRPASPASQEEYWRTRARDSRLAWRAAADRVQELEREVADLRFQFYAQDDPAYRDGEIKPAWDRAVIELAQARMRADDLETQVELVLAEGLEAGALPGWLREGLDFEPVSDDENPDDGDLAAAEVIEPPILEDPPR